MWTGGEPPPPLPPPPAAASTMETTAAAAAAAAASPQPQSQPRPSQLRNNELEELRQKGLAKLLNKHFTGVIHTLTKEKAEADAQLRDLEQRKAATSDFDQAIHRGQGQGAGQLSPFDSMYVQLKKKRNECRRKERETILLYQRYVHRFGATGAVQVPATATVLPPPVTSPPPDLYRATHNNSHTLVPSMAQAIDAKVTELKQQGADPIPTIDSLGVDTTYQTLHARDAWELQQFFRRQLEERGIDARCCTPNGGGMLNPRKLFHGPKYHGLPHLMESPGSPNSKPITATPWEYPFPPMLHGNPNAIQEEGEEGEEEYGEEYGDADDMHNFYYQPQYHQEYLHNVNGFSGYVVNNMNEAIMDDDYDDRSMVSGLTSVNSAATMLLHETENRLVQFLKTETEAIRKMLSEEGGGGGGDPTTTDMPSIKSGKSGAAAGGGAHHHHHHHSNTHTTTGSRSVSSDHMSAAQLSSTQMSHSELGSHSSRAADQAEHMVQQMQDILDQFQQEAAARGEVVTTTTATANTCLYPKKLETTNPKEEWVVYFDDTYQKEYYHEVHSNKTQWELPEDAIVNNSATTNSTSSGEGGGATTTAEAASECTATTATASLMTDYGQQQSSVHKAALLLSHEDVMPDHHHPSTTRRNGDDLLGTSMNSYSSSRGDGQQRPVMMSSRRRMYLKKRRRQRKRRLIAAMVATFAMAGLTVVWKEQYHGQETWQEAAKLVVGEKVVHQVLQMHHAVQRYFHISDHKKTEKEEMAGLFEGNATAANTTAMEDGSDVNATTTNSLEDFNATDSNSTNVVDEDGWMVGEDGEKMNSTSVAIFEEKEEDTSLEVVPEKIHRPWMCNLPLAWLFHPYCRRLASEAPLFCAHSLADSMMQ